MSLLFDADGEYVDHGSGASLDNIGAGAFLTWIYCHDFTSSTGQNNIWNKGGTQQRLWIDTFDGALFFATLRSSHCVIRATPAQLGSHWAINKWLCAAGTWNLSGAAGAQQFFTGDLRTPLVAPSGYTMQAAGSGTQQDNSAASLRVGGHSTTAWNLDGRIAVVQIFNQPKTLEELRRLQFNPRKTADTVLLAKYNQAGTIPDLSGNGNAGTITGTTSLADGIPLPAFFRSRSFVSLATVVVSDILTVTPSTITEGDTATLSVGSESGKTKTSVRFYQDVGGTEFDLDGSPVASAPWELEYTPETTGTLTLGAEVTYDDASTDVLDTVELVVNPPVVATQDATASATTAAYAASVTTTAKTAAQGATATATTAAYAASAGADAAISAAQDATASAIAAAYAATVTTTAKTAAQDQTARATSAAYAGAVTIGPAVTATQAQTARATTAAYAAAVALGSPVTATQGATARATATAYTATVSVQGALTTLEIALTDAVVLSLALNDASTLTLTLGD